MLDRYAEQPARWNIGTVFVAGGAGGGTEAASWNVFFGNEDPVVAQLKPLNMRALYNHDMRGGFAGVPNIRFVGAGKQTDLAHDSYDPVRGVVHGIDYGKGAGLCRGESDGLVPFHSQGGVSKLKGGGPAEQAYDAYCIQRHDPSPIYAWRIIENSIRRNISRWLRGRNQETC